MHDYPRSYKALYERHPIDEKEAMERFFSQVRKTATCWFWEGSINKATGYGSFHYRPAGRYAHRASYLFQKGAIPTGYVIMHICDVRTCVNPDHLAAGTRLENMQDRDQKGRYKVPTSRKYLSREEKVELARSYRPYSTTHAMLAEKYGVSTQTVRNIVRKYAPEKLGLLVSENPPEVRLDPLCYIRPDFCQ